MNGRLSARIIKLETGGGGSWRRLLAQRTPAGQWPEAALLAYLRHEMGWPPRYDPTDAELRAIAAEGDAP